MYEPTWVDVVTFLGSFGLVHDILLIVHSILASSWQLQKLKAMSCLKQILTHMGIENHEMEGQSDAAAKELEEGQ